MAFDKDQRKARGAVDLCNGVVGGFAVGPRCTLPSGHAGFHFSEPMQRMRPCTCPSDGTDEPCERQFTIFDCRVARMERKAREKLAAVKCGPGSEPCYYGKGESIRCTLPNGHEGEHAMRLEWATNKPPSIPLQGMLGMKPEGYCDKHDLMQPCTTCTPLDWDGNAQYAESAYRDLAASSKDAPWTDPENPENDRQQIPDPTMSRGDLIFIVSGSALIFALGAAFGLLLGVMLF